MNSEQEYRMLEAGNLIEPTDQYNMQDGDRWKPTECEGERVAKEVVGRYRRPLAPSPAQEETQDGGYDLQEYIDSLRASFDQAKEWILATNVILESHGISCESGASIMDGIENLRSSLDQAVKERNEAVRSAEIRLGIGKKLIKEKGELQKKLTAAEELAKAATAKLPPFDTLKLYLRYQYPATRRDLMLMDWLTEVERTALAFRQSASQGEDA